MLMKPLSWWNLKASTAAMISVRRLTRRTYVRCNSHQFAGRRIKYNKTGRTGRRDYEDDIQQCIRSDRAYSDDPAEPHEQP